MPFIPAAASCEVLRVKIKHGPSAFSGRKLPLFYKVSLKLIAKCIVLISARLAWPRRWAPVGLVAAIRALAWAAIAIGRVVTVATAVRRLTWVLAGIEAIRRTLIWTLPITGVCASLRETPLLGTGSLERIRILSLITSCCCARDDEKQPQGDACQCQSLGDHFKPPNFLNTTPSDDIKMMHR